MKKRILALLLAAVLLTNTVPVSVLAEQAPVAPAEVSADPSAESPAGPGTEVMPMDEPEVEPEPQPDPCGTCGVVGCTSEHLNWCDACKKDDCGVDHTVVVEPCGTCGVVGCTSEHLNWCDACKKDDCGVDHTVVVEPCSICKQENCTTQHEKCPICQNYDCNIPHVYCQTCKIYDCGKTHVYCYICGEYDCGKTHTSVDDSEYRANIGSCAMFDLTYGSFPVVSAPAAVGKKDVWSSSIQLSKADIPADLILVINNVYVNETEGLYWYEVKAATGADLPDSFPEPAWVFQNYVGDSYGDSLIIVEKPQTGCGCCENCIGVEDCDCNCVDCDFYEEPVLPDVPSEPSWGEDPYPELPSLYHPENEVAVYAEELPAGTSLVVEEADVTAQLRAFGVSASKLVFGLDISLGGYQTEALVKVAVSECPGTLIGILHTHGSKTTYIGIAEVLSDGTVEFVTDGFSEFAGFTVDFHYGGVDFSIDGMTSILLSELFEEMGIDEDAYDATSVVFSDPDLVDVTEEGNDWRLTSLKAFQTEETLVITFSDGHVIVMDVTDDAKIWSGTYETTVDVYGSATTTATFYLFNASAPQSTHGTSGYVAVATAPVDTNGWTKVSFPGTVTTYWHYVSGSNVQIQNYDSHQVQVKATGSNPIIYVDRINRTIVDRPSVGAGAHVTQKRYASNNYEARTVRILVNNDIATGKEEHSKSEICSAIFPIVSGTASGQLDVQYVFHASFFYGKADRSKEQGKGNGSSSYNADTSGEYYTYDSSSKTYTIPLWTRYNVVFDGNGATSGAMENQPFIWDEQKALTKNAYVKRYTVTYEVGSGSVSPKSATSTAQFQGWAESTTGAVVHSDQKPVVKLSDDAAGTVRLYAKWSNMPSVTLPTPTPPAGHTFVAWTDGTKTYKAGESYTPTKDVTMTAIWNTNSYWVEFHGNGATGGAMSNQAFSFDLVQTLTSNAYVRKYTVAYNTNGGNTIPNVTATATFNGWEDRGEIVFNGTTWKHTQFDAPFYAKNSPDVVAAAGYGDGHYNKYGLLKHFIEWGKNEWNNGSTGRAPTGDTPGVYPNGATVSKLSTTAGYVVPLYANWTLGSVTLPTPTKTGYTFKGWSDGTKTYAAGASYTPTANATLTAQWTPNTYKVTLDNQDATTAGTPTYWYQYNTTQVINGETVYYYTNEACTEPLSKYTIIKPTRTGYTFGGYWTGTNGTGTQYVDANGMCINNLYTAVAGNSTLYAKWTPIKYTITYNLDDGSVVSANPIEYTIETPTFTLNNPTKTNHTFTGWTGTGLSSASTCVTIAQGSTGNRSYTATWKLNVYTVTFDPNGGMVSPTSKSVTYNEKYGSLPTPNYTGYSFGGWYTAATGGAKVTENTIYRIEGDSTLYAHWTPNEYTYDVVYKSESGKQLETTTVTKKFDTTNTIIPKAFDGYETPDSQTVEWDSTNKKTITFTYKLISYTIGYTLDGGTVTDNPTSYNVETATFTLDNPSKTGYTFAGWTGTGFSSASKTVTIALGSTGERRYTANWTPIIYNITYDLAGGTVATANPTTYTIETERFTLNNPTKAGYDFTGWTGTGLTEATETVIVDKGNTGHRSYTAMWKVSTFVLTIKTNNTVDANQNYIFDVSGKTVEGNSVFLSVVLAAQDEQSIVGLPAGDYTVSDRQAWSWRYDGQSQTVTYAEVETHKPTFDYAAMIQEKIYWLNGYNYGICEVGENKKTKGGGKR